MPEVSFLLPVYNGAGYLRDTLASLRAQSFEDFEVLVVDDGSTDDTGEIVSSFDMAPLRYVRTDNSGLVAALNAGLEMLDCTYVARIDADDICFANRLAAQVEFIEFTRADAIASRAINMDDAGRPWGLSPGNAGFYSFDAGLIPAREPYLPHPFLLARRAVLVELGGYRQAHLAEDSDLYWRLAERHRIALQDSVLGQYRIHAQSVSSGALASARIQAFYSQLAALNALRRRDGKDEVAYDLPMATARAAAGSIDSLLALVADRLDASEQAHLQMAAVFKLMDIATYRKFTLSPEELAQARDLAAGSGVPRASRASVDDIMGHIAKWYPQDGAGAARSGGAGLLSIFGRGGGRKG